MRKEWREPAMHETLRRRILRRLETLPEARLYQVLDYIEFLESRYGEGAPEGASNLQTLAERIEDGLRRRTLSPTTLREAFQILHAADRVLHTVSEAGKGILAELQLPPEADRPGPSPPRDPEGDSTEAG